MRLTDDGVFMLNESEVESLDDSAGSESDGAEGRPTPAKRRRPLLRSTSSDTGEYDQDEAALQQAIALSMEGTFCRVKCLDSQSCCPPKAISTLQLGL